MNIPKIVGILNITPDSFSDGGNFINEFEALKQVELMINNGVNVIDVGAESTRPNAKPIDADQEWQRLESVLPKIINITKKYNILSSLDTRHWQTASKAINLGIDWINDVNSLNDIQMIEVIAVSKVKAVFMHSLSVPADKNIVLNENYNPVEELLKWAKNKIKDLNNHGIETNRLVFDPGIGFGKTPQQSLEIIKEIDKFKGLNCSLFVGHSRKSFFNLINDSLSCNKDIETLITSVFLQTKQVDFVRVHNVEMHNRAFKTLKYLNS